MPELNLSELARRVGVAKSTAHRTCSVLVGRGLLDRTDAGGYRLGLRFVEYGHLASIRSAVRDRGLPLLVELRNSLGETVQIGVPAGVDVVYVERVEGMRALRYASENSRRSPLHRSSAGKVLAAYDARAAGGAPAGRAAGRARATRSWCPSVFVAELSRVRQRGYARSVDETELGMSSLAVPVWARPGGAVVAAISMVGPTSRVVGEHEVGHVTALTAGARRLTDALARGEYAAGGAAALTASALAGRAGVAHAVAQLEALDGRSAAQADGPVVRVRRLASPRAISCAHLELARVDGDDAPIAAHPCAAWTRAVSQRQLQLGLGQVPAGATRIDAAHEQHLGPVDVAEPGDDRLVEQHGADGPVGASGGGR